MPEDTMGDERNLTLDDLADAAIAGNDGNADDFLQKTKETLDMITKEELQAKIDQKKSASA